MNTELGRGIAAELLGTFMLVFIGSAAVIVAPIFGVIVPALAHGLALTAIIYIYGHLSGGQVNPAVTLGLLIGGKQDLTKSLLYMAAQFAGGIIAAFVLLLVLGGAQNSALLAFLGNNSFNYGQTTGFLTQNYAWNAAVFETILTFFLVSAVYQAAVYKRAGNLAGVAIGLTLAVSILAGGAATGASLNPARTLGPAIIAGDFSYLLPYFVGIFAGGALAGLLHAYVLPSPLPTSE